MFREQVLAVDLWAEKEADRIVATILGQIHESDAGIHAQTVMAHVVGVSVPRVLGIRGTRRPWTESTAPLDAMAVAWEVA